MGKLYGFKDPIPSVYTFGRYGSRVDVIMANHDIGYEFEVEGVAISDDDLERLAKAFEKVAQIVFQRGIGLGARYGDGGLNDQED